jgi:hypothetical protein
MTLVPRISVFFGITIAMYHDEARHLGRPQLPRDLR